MKGRWTKWLRVGLAVLGLLAWALAVILAGPIIQFGREAQYQPFASAWVQGLLILLPLLGLLVWAGFEWRRRRRGQQALEQAMLAEGAGDEEEISRRIQQALATLRHSSRSKNFLYELPWYVLIGPPGSGKTTALLNAGIKFPLAEQKGGLQGIGGTRYCDWWFTEEAVLIDTAGRYITQDSNRKADAASWEAFLRLLKKHRPRQPLNGVLLTLPVSELMTAGPETLARHAETIRERLAEIQQVLKVDFPVYVLLTKADLISGFREYFGNLNPGRRRRVWGVTFQTEDRKALTHEQAPAEFDALLARLSGELIDRLSEEPDGASRIAIFSLPGQLAALRDPLASFLRQVFEPTRYKSNAILRGFYLTSGTQEGTPIDQVLGALGSGAGEDRHAMMAGRGRSYFLHDLLAKVVFAEQGWVSYDRANVRRSTLLRAGAMGALALCALGLLTAWGISYVQNRDLVANVAQAKESFDVAGRGDLEARTVADTDLARIDTLLNMLRRMPAGVDGAQGQEATWSEGFGLGQRAELARAARRAYADALERLLRPRLILQVEEQLEALMRAPAGREIAIYETLRVYKLLGRFDGSTPDDDYIRAWFATDWAQISYPGAGQEQLRASLGQHLDFMLQQDDERVALGVTLNGTLIGEAERRLAQIPIEDRAYSLIAAAANANAGLPPLLIGQIAGNQASLVFETRDGSDLSAIAIPGFYTLAGFRDFFLPQLGTIGERMRADQWVLGEAAAAADGASQISRLGPRLMERYSREFSAAWEGTLGQIRVAPLSADKPAYRALSAIAAPNTSPLLMLAQTVARETGLTVEADPGQSPPTVNLDGLRSIGLEIAMDGGKSGAQPGGAGRRAPPPGARIAADFAAYQALVQGPPGGRLIDELLGDLEKIQIALASMSGFNAAGTVTGLEAQIGGLHNTSRKLPAILQGMVGDVVREFRGDAVSASLAQMNAKYGAEVLPRCTQVVEGRYPFGTDTSRQIPMADFAEVFRPNGLLDAFFEQNLAAHADMTDPDAWRWNRDSPLGDKLSPTALRQFQHAARIRDAFFAGRSPEMKVKVVFRLTAAHRNAGDFLLSVDGDTRQMSVRGGPPQSFDWPGRGTGSALSLLSARPGETIFTQGPWSLLDLISLGSPRQTGQSTIQLSYILNGRDLRFEVTTETLANPFNLAELREFRCPKGL